MEAMNTGKELVFLLLFIVSPLFDNLEIPPYTHDLYYFVVTLAHHVFIFSYQDVG